MKKPFVLAISLLAVLALLIGLGAVSCGGNGDEAPPGDENGPPPDGNGGEGDGQTNFTSADGLIEISLESVERTEALLHYEQWGEPVAAEGYDFVVVVMRVVRIDDGHLQIAPESNPVVFGDDGVEYEESYGAWDISINDPAAITSAESKAGATITLAFELPEDVQPVSLRLPYLYFESWSEDWEPLGGEEGYVDVTL